MFNCHDIVSEKTRKLNNTTINVKWVYDFDADLSYLGEFCNEKPSAIKRKPENIRRNEYRYFLPANPEYGQSDLRLMEDISNGNMSCMGCIVEMTYLGEITTNSSLWGIIGDNTDTNYCKDVEKELRLETIYDLKEKVNKLRKTLNRR